MSGFAFVLNKEMNFTDGSSHICSIAKGYSGEEFALIYGQLRALFGEPNYESKDLENQYSYCLKATDEQGETVVIEVYSGSSGPAIGGMKDEKSRLAAAALIEKINEAKPADYEYEGYYMDGPSKVRQGVKDGKAFYQEEEIELESEEFKKACKLIYSKPEE